MVTGVKPPVAFATIGGLVGPTSVGVDPGCVRTIHSVTADPGLHGPIPESPTLSVPPGGGLWLLTDKVELPPDPPKESGPVGTGVPLAHATPAPTNDVRKAIPSEPSAAAIPNDRVCLCAGIDPGTIPPSSPRRYQACTDRI